MNIVDLIGTSVDDDQLCTWLGKKLMQSEIDEDGYIELHDRGIELLFCSSTMRLETIFMFNEPVTEGQIVERFRGDLPKGLEFSMSRTETRKLLGTPRRVVEGGSDNSVRPLDAFRIGEDAELIAVYSETEDYIMLVLVDKIGQNKKAEPESSA